ncbi:MAG: hypothetical protein JWN50_249 [Parcubacteria group bacterium]|nr:hypothetical protein [Parcubacteria group bacterium]
MIKKLSIISIILILLGLGVWYFFRGSSSPSVSQTLSNILPFGSGGNSTSPGTNAQNGSTSGVGSNGTPVAHLFKISDIPVAGATALIKNGSLVVRYVERATGHIYDVDPVSLAKTEIVNTTIPKVYEAVFKPGGNMVIFRTLRADGETVDSSSIVLVPPTGTTTSDMYTTKTTGLPANISELSNGSTTIFYTLRNFPQIVTSLFDGTKAATIFSSAFDEWRLSAAGDASVVVTAKASTDVDGYSYSLTKAGNLTKLLGPLPGLTVLSNSNLTRIAYSYTTGGETDFATQNLSTGTTYAVRPATLAEKCVWSTIVKSVIYCGAPVQGIQSGEPDLWYKGISHYSDRIWKFDTDADFVNAVADPKHDFNIDIDAEHLFLSPKEDYLFFQNKNDLTLWALKLN